ncbi:MAG: hypothetical protein QOH76_3148 [Thermoleophilaceae bacterium]|nr:hypothetical protein [Thermoleophilaceae bacterium]
MPAGAASARPQPVSGTRFLATGAEPSVNADGRFVAYSGGPANASDFDAQIYMRDRRRRTTSLVSRSAVGDPGNLASTNPSISASGRFVAFLSRASDLVPGDTNGAADVFVRDRSAGTTVRASVSTTEAQADGRSEAPSLSADGRFVAFTSHARNLGGPNSFDIADIYVRDVTTGTIERASIGVGGAEPNADSFAPAVSGDGGTVVFTSHASNLVGGDTNGSADVFAYDRATRTVRRVSIAANGDQADGPVLTFQGGPSPDFDSSVVAFGTAAPNMLGGSEEYDIVARDIAGGTVQRLSTGAGLDNLYEEAESSGPSVSADGRRVAFAGPGPQVPRFLGSSALDVYVRDRGTGGITRVSQLSQCRPAEEVNGFPSISANGRWVAFQSNAISLLAPGVYRGGPSPPVHLYVASALPARGTEVCRIAVFPRNNDPGTNTKFRLVLSQMGRVTIRIYRRRVGRRSVLRRTLRRTGLHAGLNTIRFSPRRLAAGRYVAIANGSARGAPSRRARFTVRRP